MILVFRVVTLQKTSAMYHKCIDQLQINQLIEQCRDYPAVIKRLIESCCE